MTASQWTAAAAGTLCLAAFSWAFSIRARRYHGISRFFAFESLLFMLLLAPGRWFRGPFSPPRLASRGFLIVSLYLAVHGIFLLVRLGKPRRGDWENTDRLVTTGLYGLIRHPLYASLMYLGAGIFLEHATTAAFLLAVLNTAALYLTARIEEGEMIAKFGEEYRDYMGKTKMFVPFLF